MNLVHFNVFSTILVLSSWELVLVYDPNQVSFSFVFPFCGVVTICVEKLPWYLSYHYIKKSLLQVWFLMK